MKPMFDMMQILDGPGYPDDVAKAVLFLATDDSRFITGEIINIETSPDAVALERIFFSKNVSSAFSVGQALGVCLLRASQADVPVFQYSPNEVKQAVSGYGKASKHQVQKMVVALLGAIDLPVSDHVSDALAVAICHINRAGNLLERLSDK